MTRQLSTWDRRVLVLYMDMDLQILLTRRTNVARLCGRLVYKVVPLSTWGPEALLCCLSSLSYVLAF